MKTHIHILGQVKGHIDERKLNTILNSNATYKEKIRKIKENTRETDDSDPVTTIGGLRDGTPHGSGI